MYVAQLHLHDFRSYADLDLHLEPGVTVLQGHNGVGKTNIVEAIDYLPTLSSHRVATDAPLVRVGAPFALVAATVVRDTRSLNLEIAITPGKANRAKLAGTPLPRTRDIVGIVRTVVFAPDDLALVKGDPSERRRFLDELATQQIPRLAGVRSDYERVLKQRNTLLKSFNHARRGDPEAALATLGIWDEQLARLGAELTAARLRLVTDLSPYVAAAYAELAEGAGRVRASIAYQPRVEAVLAVEPTPGAIEAVLLDAISARRQDELQRGVSLVGPHRDDLSLALAPLEGEPLPVKGYASHGESWTFALALRLASFDLARSEGDDPVLILDDVFAELDAGRRGRLAELVEPAEQLLITAAVAEDVPDRLVGARFRVAEGRVERER